MAYVKLACSSFRKLDRGHPCTFIFTEPDCLLSYCELDVGPFRYILCPQRSHISFFFSSITVGDLVYGKLFLFRCPNNLSYQAHLDCWQAKAGVVTNFV